MGSTWGAMALIGVHFILIILGLDFIQTKHFLVETEDGVGGDKGTGVPTAEDFEKGAAVPAKRGGKGHDYQDDDCSTDSTDSTDSNGSVGFAIDTTRSMIAALPMVKKMIADLVKTAPKIPTWVLTSFKDPEVKLVRKTSDVEELKTDLDALNYGGDPKDDLKEQALKGIEVTLDNMPNNGVILVVTDAGSKQLKLERSITRKSFQKNIKIYFTFYPTCRADCDDSLPVYERLSDGEMFNSSEFTSEKFFSTVITKVKRPCSKTPSTVGTTAGTTEPTTAGTTEGTTEPTTEGTTEPAKCEKYRIETAPDFVAHPCPEGKEIEDQAECMAAAKVLGIHGEHPCKHRTCSCMYATLPTYNPPNLILWDQTNKIPSFRKRYRSV